LLTEKDMKKSIAFFTFCAMLFALCGSVDAQQTGKVSRLGYLDGGTASGMATVLLNAFRHELSKLGWIEGKNITIGIVLQSNSLTACQSLRRNSLVKRLI